VISKDKLTCPVSNGRSVLAKSVTPSRIKENLRLVELEAGDVEEIDKIVDGGDGVKGPQRYVYPDFGVDFGFPDKA
jgi:diketogulonate reductase-like aldo/keto reductase